MDYITEMKIKDNIKTIFNKLKNVKFIKTNDGGYYYDKNSISISNKFAF